MDAAQHYQAAAQMLVRMEFSYDDCRDQLMEVKNVLEVQGATITDVRVTDTKERKKVLGIF